MDNNKRPRAILAPFEKNIKNKKRAREDKTHTLTNNNIFVLFLTHSPTIGRSNLCV